MHDALLRIDNLAHGIELRIVANHLRRDVEHERGLVLVGRRAVDLAADFAVTQQKVNRQGRGEFRLAVLARQHQQARPVLPQAVLPLS